LTEALRRATAGLGVDESPENVLLRTLKELRPTVPTEMAYRQLEAALVRAASQAITNRAAFGPRIFDMLLIEAQRALIRRAVAECNGILDRAATLLGMTLHELEAIMGNLGLSQSSLNFA
jgi:hypothetical protein